MNDDWSWPGARWWRCDLHLHTYASHDVPKEVTPAQWIEAARSAGLDAVAVTDHNTAEWVDRIGEATGSTLTVFPGVELTVSGGAHLLVLFAPGTSQAEIQGLLGACDVQEIGRDRPAHCSFVEAMEKATTRGAVVVAAHITTAKGVFAREGFGQTLQQILSSENLDAVEINDELASIENLEDRDKLLKCLRGEVEGYARSRGRLPILTFSDAHSIERIGSRTTWIKMTRPTLDGLRLALQDGQPLSVRNSWQDESGDPNRHAEAVIERIEVNNLQFMGRGEPFAVDFNPWLNAIVGGRGTGKSTLVESLRLVFRRVDELPERLRQRELDHFYRVFEGREDRGLLTERSRITVIYRRGAVRYRIHWRQDGEGPNIEEEKDDTWRPSPGLVRERFPIRIYSQKQVFELARDPAALLRIIDEAPEVRRQDWENEWESEVHRYLELRGRVRTLCDRLAEEESIRGQLEDLHRKIEVFEQSGHAELLRAYHRRRRQRREVDRWLEQLRGHGEQIRKAAKRLEGDPPEGDLWQEEDEADQVLEIFDRTSREVETLRTRLLELAEEADSVISSAAKEVAESAWARAAAQTSEEYTKLVERLQREGVSDPAEFGALVQRRQVLEESLRSLEAVGAELETVRSESEASVRRLAGLRRELSRRRAKFLEQVLPADGKWVRARLVPYGDISSVARGFREVLGGTEHHGRDIGDPESGAGILGRLYAGYPAAGSATDSPVGDFEKCLEDEKERLRRIFEGDDAVEVGDRRFANHVQGLPPEFIDRLRFWYPEDSLQVFYSPDGDGEIRSIEQASPGQKTAALLTFLLSYGNEPIVLDQPEDDLDNHLIYSLLVQRLRKIKVDRQVIVVTHNPNIVVHGDAELVVSLDQRGGCTRKIAAGGLQESEVRDEVCRVMEGGEDALRRRYQRIVGLPGRRKGG